MLFRSYDVLAAVEGDDKRKMLSKKEALKIEPLLPENILKGAGYYAEYRTDDARLTLELIKTSLRYGAKPINYVEVTDFLYEDSRVSGAKVKDALSNKVFDIKSKYVVNATEFPLAQTYKPFSLLLFKGLVNDLSRRISINGSFRNT